MVLSAPEVFPNSEERRLFYVALTRAKKKVFLATGSGKRSEFIDEVIKSPIDIEIFGKKLPEEPKCEKCKKGTLRLKEEFGFWGCKNHPYCKNKEQACPYCKKGFPQRHADSTISCSVCEQQIEKCPEAGCKGLIQQRQNKNMETFSGGALNILIPIKSAVTLELQNIRKTTTIRDTKNILKVLLNRAATNSAVQVVLINNLQIMESLGKKYKMIN